MQDEVSTAIASFTRMWQNGELEKSDSLAQSMLGSFPLSDPNLDSSTGESDRFRDYRERKQALLTGSALLRPSGLSSMVCNACKCCKVLVRCWKEYLHSSHSISRPEESCTLPTLLSLSGVILSLRTVTCMSSQCLGVLLPCRRFLGKGWKSICGFCPNTGVSQCTGLFLSSWQGTVSSPHRDADDTPSGC